MYKLLKIAVLVCLAAYTQAQCFRHCSTFSGPECRDNQQIFESSCNCSRRCINIFPPPCEKICPLFEGDDCKDGQIQVLNYCNCKKRCVDILPEGNKCNAGKTSKCGDKLKCLDGVCVPV